MKKETSMFERIDLAAGPLVGLRIQNDITHGENQALVELVQRRFRQFGPVRLLVVYEANPGLMGAEGLYDNMRFAKLTSEMIVKLAVMGQYDWEDTWIALFGLFGGIQAKYFDRSQLEATLAWLKA
jgi:SpoIIAA-like